MAWDITCTVASAQGTNCPSSQTYFVGFIATASSNQEKFWFARRMRDMATARAIGLAAGRLGLPNCLKLGCERQLTLCFGGNGVDNETTPVPWR
jgi:hypothetical protein